MQGKKNKTNISVSQSSFIGSHSLLSRVFHKIKDPRNKVDSSFGSLTCWLADCAHRNYCFNQLPIPYPRRKTRANMHTGIIRKNTKKADQSLRIWWCYDFFVFLCCISQYRTFSNFRVVSLIIQIIGCWNPVQKINTV